MPPIPEGIKDFTIRVKDIFVILNGSRHELPLHNGAISTARRDDVGVLFQETNVHDVRRVRAVRAVGRVVDHGRAVEELHETVVVGCDDKLAISSAMDSVDICAIRRERPNAHDGKSKNARPRVPRRVGVC